MRPGPSFGRQQSAESPRLTSPTVSATGQKRTLRIPVKLVQSGGCSEQIEDLLSGISGVAQRPQLAVRHDFRQCEGVPAVQMNMVVQQRGKSLDVLGIDRDARLPKLVQHVAHV